MTRSRGGGVRGKDDKEQGRRSVRGTWKKAKFHPLNQVIQRLVLTFFFKKGLIGRKMKSVNS